MVSRLNARANVHVHTIVYMTGILVILITAIWFLKNNPFEHLMLIDKVDHDLIKLSERANIACNAEEYNISYNPLLQEGVVRFHHRDLCIRVPYEGDTNNGGLQRCTKLLCSLHEEKRYNITVTKNIVLNGST